MKIKQLIEIENVKGANRVLKNLLERTRSENVGLGLFYGRPGLGKTRWSSKTAQENGYVYIRLEANITTKDFLRDLLSKLLHKTMPLYDVRGTKNEIYNQILDFLQSEQDTVIFVDELDYAFSNEQILATLRDLADQSLATFVLIGMESCKDKLLRLNNLFFDRTNAHFEFKNLSLSDSEKVLRGICEVCVCMEIIKFIHNRSNGTMRIINKYVDAIEKIAKRMKRDTLSYEEIKDIIVRVEVK